MRNCSVVDCGRTDTGSTGWCKKHYLRWLRHGDPLSELRRRGENRKQNPRYRAYNAMLERCTNPNCKAYEFYGGRGIKVCERWLGTDGFNNYILDTGTRPPGMSLDRINNDGNYEPGNVRWATCSQQQHNKRQKPGGTGVKGVTKDGNAFRVKIKVEGKTINLGRYKNLQEAGKVYDEAKRKVLNDG